VVARLKLRVGDLIVMGSDGLFDNLYTDDIVNLVNEGGTVDAIAQRLSKTTSDRAAQSNYLSPFATYIRSLGKFPEWVGGKLDDITTVVAKVSSMNAKARKSKQSELQKQLADMLQADESKSTVCEVCGFKFKTPALRQAHVKQVILLLAHRDETVFAKR
jgi:hypothetical protein